MFPDKLDGARVLYFTEKRYLGQIHYVNGEIADSLFYLAICAYETGEYYLFKCSDTFEVVQDSVWNSIEECMYVANSSYGNVTWMKMK